MSLLTGIGDFFGLDIGTSSIRVVQLRHSAKQSALLRYGSSEIDMKVAMSDSETDQKRLADMVMQTVRDAGITSKNVAVGIPSSRTFATVVDIQRLPPAELKKTVSYQAENFIPQPLNEVKLDWAVLGDSPKDRDKIEVLVSTVNNSFAESRLNALESVGLNVIALEPDSLALVRSLTPPETTGAQLILDIGNAATDLVISYQGTPRLIRSIPTGGSSFVRVAMNNLNIDEKQAKQFVYKFGMSKDKLEGQVYKALHGTVDTLTGEIEKSIKFFKQRYNTDLEKIIVTGGASTLPEFPLYLANKLNIAIEIGNSWSNVSFPNDKYNELLAASNQFATATGLALRAE